MTISFKCQNCGTKLSAPSDKAGKKSKCPVCGNQAVIPGERPAPTVRQQLQKPEELPIAEVLPPAPQPMVAYAHSVPVPKAEITRYKECMACAEPVLENARICKHCGLDPDEMPRKRRRREDDGYDDRRQQQATHIHVKNESRTYVKTGGRGFPHRMHFVLTVLTCGLWLPVWLFCWLLS